MDRIFEFDFGDQVEVDPKKGNPPHSFVGVVVDIDYSHEVLSVRDQEDDVFDVDVDQVTPF